MRVWAKGQDGSFWPTKKGTSVRVSEISGVIKALVNAAEALGVDTRAVD